MNAVIYLNVPDWQIGQDVTVYFPDAMVKHCKCELLKEQEAVVRCKDCKWYIKEEPGYTTGLCRLHDGFSYNPDYFCADGKHEEYEAMRISDEVKNVRQ